MNKFLASAIAASNSFLAWLFVAAGVVSGYTFGMQVYQSESHLFLIAGGVVGLIVAILFCGLLALFIDMRRLLVKISELTENGNNNLSEIKSRIGDAGPKKNAGEARKDTTGAVKPEVAEIKVSEPKLEKTYDQLLAFEKEFENKADLEDQYEKQKSEIIKTVRTELKIREQVELIDAWARLKYQDVSNLGKPNQLNETALPVYRLLVEQIIKSLSTKKQA